MCGECSWIKNTDERSLHLQKKCDCGSTHWQHVSLPMEEKEAFDYALFRCKKCDQLHETKTPQNNT